MSKGYNNLVGKGGVPHRSLSEITTDRQRGRSSIHRTGHTPGKDSVAKRPTILSLYQAAGIQTSMRWMKNGPSYPNKYKKLRLESDEVTGKLGKAQVDLRKAKAELKIKEERARFQKRVASSITTAEEDIKKAMEDLAAKENLAAARREKKDARREIWAKKQVEDCEKGDARRQECARLFDGDQRPNMVGAVVAMEAVEDEFDTDIYSDQGAQEITDMMEEYFERP